MKCPVCNGEVQQVASATPALALFQHLVWIHNVLPAEAWKAGDIDRASGAFDAYEKDPDWHEMGKG